MARRATALTQECTDAYALFLEARVCRTSNAVFWLRWDWRKRRVSRTLRSAGGYAARASLVVRDEVEAIDAGFPVEAFVRNVLRNEEMEQQLVLMLVKAGLDLAE